MYECSNASIRQNFDSQTVVPRDSIQTSIIVQALRQVRILLKGHSCWEYYEIIILYYIRRHEICVVLITALSCAPSSQLWFCHDLFITYLSCAFQWFFMHSWRGGLFLQQSGRAVEGSLRRHRLLVYAFLFKIVFSRWLGGWVLGWFGLFVGFAWPLSFRLLDSRCGNGRFLRGRHNWPSRCWCVESISVFAPGKYTILGVLNGRSGFPTLGEHS